MLTVYRASAGSGKTHLLTGTYMRMLFQENTTYENILAVTFTNKATDEMKQRIIEQLHLLATDPAASDYAQMLVESYGLDTRQVSEKAARILIAILHNYSGFNVSTIDHFFQQTTRAFTREIGLQGGYEIELDSDKVRNEAIDRMIASLDKPENKTILDWLILFAGDKAEDSKDWNIRKDLLSLSREILKEEYKKNQERIRTFTADKKNIENYIGKMKEIIASFEEVLKMISRNAADLMQLHGLELSDFPYGKSSGAATFFKWLDGRFDPPGSRFVALKDDLKKWTGGKCPAELKARIEAAFSDGLNECIHQALATWDTAQAYHSAQATLRYLYTLGILGDIDHHMREYSREHNLMLISDTTELLNRVIDGRDTPFIYEKIGTRITHYMIDEFQDTSGMQWDNFRPLISDSLAQDFGNLIVGDVKQSIYRWRNSDWMLLHDRLRRYEDAQREDRVLETNWRSCRNIVNFNNAFFTIAAMTLQDLYNASIGENVRIDESYRSVIRDAYADIYQHVPEKKKDQEGHVRIEFIEPQEGIDWREEVMERLPQTIISLQENGYALRDIAILVRTGKEGALVADTLLKYKAANPATEYRFDVISNEALYIGQAPVVRTILSIMKYLHDPASAINKVIAAANLQMSSTECTPDEALAAYFSGDEKQTRLFDDLLTADLENLRKQPLFEMTEQIIDKVIRRESASDKVFVQAFQDLINEFATANTADLSAFLEWWDTTGIRKTISTPDSQDAIRILTIHKSKGLGFRAVIIPFADWDIDHDAKKENIIWCEPQAEPFSEAPLVPVKYSKGLLNTIYAHEYLDEKRSAFIDNLNVAYVAFTRAKEEMILFAPLEKKPEDQRHIGSVIRNALITSLPADCLMDPDRQYISLSEMQTPDSTLFEMGSWWPITQKSSNDTEEVQLSGYISVPPGNRLQLRLHGKGYFKDKEERLYGNMMHEILAAIRYPGDIPGAVAEYVRSGSLREDEADEMEQNIFRFIETPGVAEWFSPDARIVNETDILIADGSFLRPDRVVMTDDKIIVIDYKFGKVRRPQYVRQVGRYVQMIAAMGYRNVEGYIWYVELGETERVRNVQQTLF